MRLPATLALCATLACLHLRGAPGPIVVKAVVVTTFEEDYDNPNGTGATNGEASRWIKGLHLDQVLPLPAGFRPVRMNSDGVVELMTGMATAKAAASTMAFGLDPRFDLSHAYWILAGTAGVDPARASIASAAWAEWVVDGDLDNFIDPREIPKDWPDGHIPWDKSTPFDPPASNIGQFYHLNGGLVRWAYALTRDTPLADNEKMSRYRALFTGFPNAQRPPFVLIGDNLASATYWQGTLGTEWARRWVTLYTKGKGTYTTSSCEDSGFMQAITFLSKAGRADANRVLVLRVASDYCLPRPGVTSAQSLQYGSASAYMAENEALDSAYAVGSVVVGEWVRDWAKYRDQVPGGANAGDEPFGEGHSGPHVSNTP
jgi:purine nucleoside permease